MCTTCGCSDTRGAEPRLVELEEAVLGKNDRIAHHNREELRARQVLSVNLMSSPGSGKTTLLERTIRELGEPVAVVEGDQETDFDADRIRATGAPVVQVNTGSGCHLDAAMVHGAVHELDPAPGSVLVVENVGNLVCPALFDLGEQERVVIMSVTEGPDKPLKYPHMFAGSTLVLLNKIDLLPHLDFDLDAFLRDVRRVNPEVEVLSVSATTGEGMASWYAWLHDRHPAPAMADEDLLTGRAGFDQAAAVADAVLYEGYALYPYRGSSEKNRVRWQFGVLAPRAWVEARGRVVDGIAGSTDSWWQQTECLLETPDSARVQLRLRFLQMQVKTVEARSPDGAWQPVGRLDVDDDHFEVPFEEAVPHEADLVLTVQELGTDQHVREVAVPGGTEVTDVRDHHGVVRGRVTRTREPLRAAVRLSMSAAPAPFPVRRLQVRIENTVTQVSPELPRAEVLRHSLLATHTLLAVDQGSFLSQIDPPEWATPASRECTNVRTFPVLVGPAAARDLVLSAPIILYDHPQVAPESPGELHDASEIDEILSLRTQTLTDDEKREARATDPRVADLVNRVDAMPPEVMERLHGAVRSLRPVGGPPERDDERVIVEGVAIRRGSRVRLRPRRRGTDAQDMFLAGRIARVENLMLDVDDVQHVAVTIEDDPSAELHQWYGRFHYYGLDEIEPAP